MILHLVLFRPRADLTVADADRLLGALEAAAREIPVVRGFRVGRALAGGPFYAAGGAADFPYVAIVELDDRAALETYLAHPAHAALGAAFNAGLAAAMVVDYEARDAGPGVGEWLLEAREGPLTGW